MGETAGQKIVTQNLFAAPGKFLDLEKLLRGG